MNRIVRMHIDIARQQIGGLRSRFELDSRLADLQEGLRKASRRLVWVKNELDTNPAAQVALAGVKSGGEDLLRVGAQAAVVGVVTKSLVRQGHEWWPEVPPITFGRAVLLGLSARAAIKVIVPDVKAVLDLKVENGDKVEG